MTIDDYDEMSRAQNHSCAICNKPETKSNTWRLSVDHCHKTNQVRGLLCGKCNRGIGMFDDDIEKLKNAIKYLQKD